MNPEAKIPPGLTQANADQAKPLIRIMGRLMTRRMRLPHGKISSQNVAIGHKNKKWKQELKYW